MLVALSNLGLCTLQDYFVHIASFYSRVCVHITRVPDQHLLEKRLNVKCVGRCYHENGQFFKRRHTGCVLVKCLIV